MCLMFMSVNKKKKKKKLGDRLYGTRDRFKSDIKNLFWKNVVES